jgi:hypothetical protein
MASVYLSLLSDKQPEIHCTPLQNFCSQFCKVTANSCSHAGICPCVALSAWYHFCAICCSSRPALACTGQTTINSFQGVGDSGQGFFNGILYVLFSTKVRSYFLHMCCCCGRGSGQGSVSLYSDRPTFYRSFSSEKRSEERESEDDGSEAELTGNRRQHKSLLLNS